MRCSCENQGAVRSGIRGVLAYPSDRLVPKIIERCDTCERFHSDEAAGLYYVTIRGGVARYDRRSRVIWSPR
jgi:hypothetical protein